MKRFFAQPAAKSHKQYQNYFLISHTNYVYKADTHIHAYIDRYMLIVRTCILNIILKAACFYKKINLRNGLVTIFLYVRFGVVLPK